jgi:hypothetical protein
LNGGSVSVSNNPLEAVTNANVIITDTWISMGQELEKARRLQAFEGFQITRALMDSAAPGCKFMHCLPRKPHEVTDEVRLVCVCGLTNVIGVLRSRTVVGLFRGREQSLHAHGHF